jgi:hypothetical protein
MRDLLYRLDVALFRVELLITRARARVRRAAGGQKP